MEEENQHNSNLKRIVETNKKKLNQLLEATKLKYEKLLKNSLNSAKKAYLKGKIDVLKRAVNGLELLSERKSVSSFKTFLLGKNFEDIANRKSVETMRPNIDFRQTIDADFGLGESSWDQHD